jgi:hypothetical protein
MIHFGLARIIHEPCSRIMRAWDAQVAALFGAALLGFLLGVLLMILLTSGRRDEDLVERVERSEAARRRTEPETGTADHVKPGANGRVSAQAAAAPSQTPGRPGRVDA